MSPITIFFIIGKESISFVSTAHIYWRTERGLSWFTLHDISQILYHGICKILGKMDYINNGHKAWPDCRTNPSVGSAYIVILITAHQRSCWKVMYSVLSVCHSVCSQGRDVSMRPPCMVISYRSHGNPPSTDVFKLVYDVAQTSVGKRAVGIQLKFLLVSLISDY